MPGVSRVSVLGSLVLSLALGVQPTAGAPTERISVRSDGEQANGGSPGWFYGGRAFSSDNRYVVFAGYASNLVPNDANGGVEDVFLRDRVTGTTELIALNTAGQQADNWSLHPSISPDGRYVVFASGAANLCTGDTNGVCDVFLRDRLTGTTERISVGLSGQQANDESAGPVVSADGRYVAFLSIATNLVVGDTNGVCDAFLRDRLTGTTERVSVSSSGQQANAESMRYHAPAISNDGRYVAFDSYASNLVANDTNGCRDIFVRDRSTGTTSRVSVRSDGQQVGSNSYSPSLSADGRYVAFHSIAPDLVADDTNNTWDIFVHDCATGVTERVSVSSEGAQANGESDYPTISDDGRYVAFDSGASNLVAEDTNGATDVFIHDRQTHRTHLVSIGPAGGQGNHNSFAPVISRSGSLVAFGSYAGNLVAGDTNAMHDCFVRNMAATGVFAESHAVTVPEHGTANLRIMMNGWLPGTAGVSVERIAGDADISVSSGSSLLFTHENWEEWQPVTLAAAHDADATNGQATIRCAAAGLTHTDVVATEQDDEVMTIVTESNTITVPENETAELRVKLSAQPLSDLIVSVSRETGDADIRVGSAANLTFTSSDWDTYQTVTLAADDDVDVVNGSATIRCTAPGLPHKDIAATEGDDDTLAIVTDQDALIVPENGYAWFQIKLSAQPPQDIIVSLARLAGDTDILPGSWDTVLITPYNWNGWHPASLRTLDDVDIVDGQATIRLSAPGLPHKDITATEDDDDAVTIDAIVYGDGVLVPEEGNAGFEVRLGAQPLTDVVVSVQRVAGDADLRVDAGDTLTFTPADWDVAQIVTLAAVADEDCTNGEATIRCSADGVPHVDVTAREIDDETFLVEPESVDILEGGTATFQVWLASPPAEILIATVERNDGDADIAVASGDTLTFTPSDWDAPRTVTLAAAPDADMSNDAATIRCRAPGRADVLVPVTAIDDDARILLDREILTVPEGGTAALQVKLGGQPPAPINVDFSCYEGDYDIHMPFSTTLTFTPENWDTFQNVTFEASQDPDSICGQATIRYYCPEFGEHSLLVTEWDDEATVITDVGSITIPEGGTATLRIKLPGLPPDGTIVSVARVSGDTDIRVVSGAILAFTAADWDTCKNVVLMADPDIDGVHGTATIRCSTPGLPARDVPVTERDDDAPWMTRVSVGPQGQQSTVTSGSSTISADGRCVAFSSSSPVLVLGGTNGQTHVFVYDHAAGTVELASVSSDGQQANGPSPGRPSLSADGRYVAFFSHATNLVPDDTNGFGDVFVRDRVNGTTERVSVNTDGQQANGTSSGGFVSADGRYVAFASIASNLVSADTNNTADCFIRDRLDHSTRRVNVSSTGQQADGSSSPPTISPDGRYVAFCSLAGNLVPDDTNGVRDAFVHDTHTGVTQRVSSWPAGPEADGAALTCSISATGRYVVFSSNAANLAPGDTNNATDVFVYDRATDKIRCLSIGTDGQTAKGASDGGWMSADGRYVAFGSSAGNLVSGDTNGRTDVFLYDSLTEKPRIVSSGPPGVQANGNALAFAISADARYVAFDSEATNLVAGDTNGVRDAFLFDRGCFLRTDYDHDNDVDLADFMGFQACFNGPNRLPASAFCAEVDLDLDADVDLADFLVFQGCFNGPNRPARCP